MRTIHKDSPEYRECLEALVLADEKDALRVLRSNPKTVLHIVNESEGNLTKPDIDSLLLVKFSQSDGSRAYHLVNKDEVVPDPIYIAGEGMVFVLPDNHRQ